MSEDRPPEMRNWRARLITRIVHTFFAFQRGMTLGVRAACFDNEGRVFLVKHSYVPGWHMPGGGMERWETNGPNSFMSITTGRPANAITCCFIAAAMSARPRQRSPTMRSSRQVFLLWKICPPIRRLRRVAALPNCAGSHQRQIIGEFWLLFE